MEVNMAQRRKRRNGNGAEAALESLQEDLAVLQKNMSKIVAGLGDKASEGVTQAMRTAEDVAEQVEEYGQEGVDTVRSTIRAQPLMALAISVGAGALLGAYLNRH
jgi:ElaB/YqjD/DUF883 family membrane-anchored ribosome-binding protein